MAKQIQPQQNEHMILLEFFVERVVYNENVEPSVQNGQPLIDFQFLDNEPITLEPSTKKSALPTCQTGMINMGKTCLFTLTPEQTQQAIQVFDLYVRVQQIKKCGSQEPILIGVALIPLANMLKDIIRGAGDKNADSVPGACKTFKNAVPLTNLETNLNVGYLCVSIRMSCFGKYIQTDFRMNMDHEAIDYKANEAHYRLKYNKKFEPCPQSCGNTTKLQCSDPRACGLTNPRIEPTPMPEWTDKPTTKESDPSTKKKGSAKASSKGSKGSKKGGKGKKGGDKKGKGGKSSQAPPGSCAPNIPCPETCPNVHRAKLAEEHKIQQKAEATGPPMPCPQSCHDKEKQSNVTWGDCPMTCPNIPSSEIQPINQQQECPQCCPINAELQQKPCGPQGQIPPCSLPNQCPLSSCCPFMKAPPAGNLPIGGHPQGMAPITMPVPTAPVQCPPTCPRLNQGPGPTQSMVQGQSQLNNQMGTCGCMGQQPVTMMYGSEPNYQPNPPMTNFAMDMGLGGSICCCIHEEEIPARIPCPVNYMPPPTLQGKCPFPCNNGTSSQNGALPYGPQQNYPYPGPPTLGHPPMSSPLVPSMPMGSPTSAPLGIPMGSFMGSRNGAPCLRPKPPQIVEMRPGMDENTPFRFKVGAGSIDNNQLCVSPPTFTTSDGTNYTELSDPNKQVFVLRIGKKFQGTIGGRNNVDLHLKTPPAPDPIIEVTEDSQQYSDKDFAAGAKYLLGGPPAPKSKAGSEKGEKKGKGGKKGKGKGGKAGKGGKGKKKGGKSDGSGDDKTDKTAANKFNDLSMGAVCGPCASPCVPIPTTVYNCR